VTLLQGRDAFAQGLRELGIEPLLSEAEADLLSFPWSVENGPRTGENLTVGLQVPANFPLEPPHGPCYSPAILRGSGVQGVHPGRHFDLEWDHWSRPHPAWAQARGALGGYRRAVSAYLRHLRTLNEELPPREAVPGQLPDAA
jgi:hypothetical protein